MKTNFVKNVNFKFKPTNKENKVKLSRVARLDSSFLRMNSQHTEWTLNKIEMTFNGTFMG